MANQPKHYILPAFIEQVSACFAICLNNTTRFSSIFIFLALAFSCSISQAQYIYEMDKTTRFDKMGVEDGLTSEYTTCIHQDQYGFIWIGTQFGLNLFDGYSVTKFNADPKNPEALFFDYINGMFEDDEGIMWFCTNRGISKFNRANQLFTNYLPDTIDLDNPNNNIQRILEDGIYLWVDVDRGLFLFDKQTEEFKSFGKDTLNPEKGIYGVNSNYIFLDNSSTLWVSSNDPYKEVVLCRFNREDETFTYFKNDTTNPESFNGKEVKSMIEDRDGIIWIASLGGGLLKLIDKENAKFRHYIHNNGDTNSIVSNKLQKVFEDAKGNLWTGGNAGFSILNKKTGKFTNYRIPNRTENPNWENVISNISENDDGELLLNSYEGFFKFNPSTKKIIHYTNDLENINSLSDNSVTQYVTDNTGQLWIVTGNNGVNIVNPFSNSMKRVQKKNNLISSLSSNYIGRIFVDSRNNLWLGCYSRGGLNRTKMNKEKVFDHFDHFTFDSNNPNSISSNSINAIYEDHDQTLWFGTFGGLNRFDYKNNSFKSYQFSADDSTTISSNAVEAIFEDSHGIFWVGTRNGLNIMDKKSGKFIRIPYDNKDSIGTLGSDFRVIFEDSKGNLWFGGTYLERLIRKDTSFSCQIQNDYNSDLILKKVWAIKEDDSSNLWLGTLRGGLIKINRGNQQFTTITLKDNLPSNQINGMEIDDRGFIWASTTQGLSRIDPANYSIRNYDVSDGLVDLEFIDRSSFKDEDGWLYFGGRNGFNYFHPDSLKENTYIPPVYITTITVDAEPKYFDKPLFETESIELQYNENDLSFDFVALSYINSQKNQYAFMLEGYEEDWKYVGNRRSAYYTNLSPGEYTFRVKASNNDGYWNEEGASLNVTIHPPFWATTWAYGAYLLIIFGILFLLRRYELNRLYHKQHAEIEQVNREKLSELDIEKNKFFSNISHEFRTPITLILGPLERIIGSKKNIDFKQELMLVRRNARRLQTLINQLLSLSKLESGKMQLKARPENIVKLSRLFVNSFSSMAEDKDIKLEFETDADEYIIYIDTLKIEKVANNLLSNAFKFTEKGGKIKVKIRAAENGEDSTSSEPVKKGVYICISDTGIGIRKEKIPHVFDRFYQVDAVQMKNYFGTGIGLALTKELIELHRGTITVDSEPGMGTTFTVFLQSGKEHLSDDEISESSSNGSENEDELLADDYLFVQDVVNKSKIHKPEPINKNLPLLLIVEDNDDMRAYIKSYLVGKFNIMEATNGKEGAEMAIEQVPDLIVSDLMMPFVDGNEMTIQLKNDERTSHIPIILLTAKSSMESKLEGLETGADDFLTKPFDANELQVRIRNLIKQRMRLRKLLFEHIGDADQTKLIHDSFKGMTKIDEQFLEKSKALIDENMADPDFSVEMLAKEMAMSRVQLHRKLKSLTDNSASDLIRNIRLMKAAELLAAGDLNVTQVSYEVGISSLSYFAKAFKEKYGVSPSDYA